MRYISVTACITFLMPMMLVAQGVDIIFPPIGAKENSWLFLDRCALVNETGRAQSVRLDISITGQRGSLYYSGSTFGTIVPPGVQTFKSLGIGFNSFIPTYSKPEFRGHFEDLGNLESGNLTICLAIIVDFEVVQKRTACNTIWASQSGPRLSLITPEDGAVIRDTDFDFTWTPVEGAMRNGASYCLRIIEVGKEEVEKYRSGKFYEVPPLIEECGISFSIIGNGKLPIAYNPDKAYLWTVSAQLDNDKVVKAYQIWSYTIKDNRPGGHYLIPKPQPEETYYKVDEGGTVRILYDSRYRNDTITITFYDLEAKAYIGIPIVVGPLSPGNNKIEIDLGTVATGPHLLEARIRDTKGRHSYLRFEIGLPVYKGSLNE